MKLETRGFPPVPVPPVACFGGVARAACGYLYDGIRACIGRVCASTWQVLCKPSVKAGMRVCIHGSARGKYPIPYGYPIHTLYIGYKRLNYAMYTVYG